MKRLFLAACLLTSPSAAWACANPLVVKDGTGTSQNTSSTPDTNSYCQPNVAALVGAFVDGWNVTEGTKADSAWTSGSGSVIALLKAIATGATGAVPAGTNTIGGTYPVATTTGGTGVFSEIVANNTTSVAVKASAGQVYGARGFSNNTTQVYGKLYNATQGSTTCGSGTPQDRFMIPAQTGGSGFVIPIPPGETFTTAITLCVTGGIADSDTTSPAAASYLVSIDYK
jgi:hypothetical protein